MKSQEQGLSLVELLIAATILIIALVPLMRVMMYALDTGSRANKITIATNLARDLAEEIRTQAFAEDYVIFNRATGCDYKTNYPVTSNPQCFGLETGEDPAQTRSKGGRIKVFDDVDDYNGWCRGRDCAGGYKPLETFDGHAYNGTEGYPSYHNFTRRVRIHNLDLIARQVASFKRDPFESYTSTNYTQPIKRYLFDNWSTVLIYKSGSTTERATGLSSIKQIEVTVTYDGTDTGNIKVVDVSYVVMPISEY
ncbi:hypothetical protein U27_04384 [Candidatus Vecturithrix granuli]|uniref:Prepilin-type N-terminal cleavage/methylation domain-containing protein n=1 Tax=Vecturithrix granuli TaxID=1499967 RepID=A0A081BYL2_VECG1|nr:hypothetical protein U27_04384 [Candidatus Vecturithrix granuli]